MKKYFGCLLLVHFFFVFAIQAQNTYTLQYNPADGSRYQITWISKTKMIQNMEGQNVDMDMNINLAATYHTTNEGINKRTTIVYDKLRANINVMGQDIKMDSDDKDTTNPMNTAFRLMVGKPLSILMDKYGKVLEVKGFEEILKATDDVEQQNNMKDLMGEDVLKNLIEQSFGFYPKAPVKVGESWETIINLTQPYPIQSSAVYTLTEVKGKKANLSILGQLNSKDSSLAISGLANTDFSLGGSFSGTSEVDIDTGMPLNGFLKQILKGNIESGNQKTPLEITTEVSFTSVVKP